MLKVDIRSFSYSSEPILGNINFNLNKGEHYFILGESGCGKSTLLHLIYGLMDMEDGTIFWNNAQLFGPSKNLIPGHSFVKLVAQEFDLMPFTSVGENISTHLTRANLQHDQTRVKELLDVVGLTKLADQKVKNLSGGQKQRVALAKALAKEPELLLLDEPFSHIDSFRKNGLRRSLFEYLKKQNIACLVATHDSAEALSFSDKIMIMRGGEIEKYDRPENIYNNIETEYQAGFFEDTSRIPNTILGDRLSNKDSILFPHQLRVSKEKTKLQVTVKKSYFRGSHFLVLGTFEDREIFFTSYKEITMNKKIYLTWTTT